MAALRKSLLALTAVWLALVVAGGAAYAQLPHPGSGLLTCAASAVPPLVRAEGIAELVGDIIAQCQVSSTIGLPQSVLTNVTVTLNTNVTNNINFGRGGAVTDAVVVVDEVTTTGTCSDGSGASPCAASSPSGSLSPSGANRPLPHYGTQISNNTLQWLSVLIPVPTTLGTFSTVRISNIRSNVSQLGIPTESTFPSTQVTAFLSFTGPTTVPVTNNVLNVGIPLLGLVQRLRGPGFLGTQGIDQLDVALPIVRLQCVSQNVDGSGNLINVMTHSLGVGGPPLSPPGGFSIRLSEGFATAFKTLGTPTNFPGTTQVEDGFLTPPSGINAGGATQGTRFVIRFRNVPTGLRIGTPAQIDGTISAGHVLRILKVANTDANGAGPLSASLATTVPLEVIITGGTGFVVYEVIDSNPFAQEAVVVPITVGWAANTANDLPAVGTLQVSASFGPTSTVTTANRDAPEPRFVDTGVLRNAFSIARCVTTLLYPFVTNQAGFDTGFSIANTSRDPFGTPAQSGTCTLNYYGGTTGGGAAPSPQTSAVVASGATMVWTLSGGNAAVSITGTPGFQGYIIAVCQFQFAHGFAFITDGFGGVPTIAEGYLALIIPNPSATGGRFANPNGGAPAGSGEGLAN